MYIYGVISSCARRGSINNFSCFSLLCLSFIGHTRRLKAFSTPRSLSSRAFSHKSQQHSARRPQHTTRTNKKPQTRRKVAHHLRLSQQERSKRGRDLAARSDTLIRRHRTSGKPPLSRLLSLSRSLSLFFSRASLVSPPHVKCPPRTRDPSPRCSSSSHSTHTHTTLAPAPPLFLVSFSL